MTGLESRSRLPRALVRLGLRAPRRVLAAWLLAAIAATGGVAQLRIETSTDSILDRSGESWRFYQQSQQWFGGDEFLTVLISGETPFEPGVLDDVIRLSEAWEALPGVWRVDSLATVPLIRSTPDGDLSLEPSLADGAPRSEAERAALAMRVGADRIAPRSLVSADGRSFAINVVLAHGAEDFYDSVLPAIDAAVDATGRDAWISGVPIFRRAADGRTREELLLFVPFTLAVVGVVLGLVFGSGRAVAVPLATSAVGTWLMVGAMGALGVPLTITTVVLPSVLLALGCAYGVHLLCAVSSAPRAEQAAALDAVSLPIALSGLTTALGFVAVSFVRIDAIRQIGGFGAAGVLIVLAATLTAGPALLVAWPLPRRTLWLRGWIGERLAPLAVRVGVEHRAVVIAAWIAAMAAVSVGIARLDVETDVIRWFRASDPVRASYEQIKARLSGISPMNVIVQVAGDGGAAQGEQGRVVTDPDGVAALDGLAAHLESLPEVGRALSIADPLGQLHAGFSGDAAAPLPDGAAMIDQYLILLEAKPYIHDLIAPDRSAANVLLRVDDNGSGALLAVGREAERWWGENGPAGLEARATGIMFEFGRAEDTIAYGQLLGLGFAFVAVLTILVAIFRWLRLALLALVPNVVPVAMGFGAMGLLGVPLDAGTVVIGNLAFGIAVDDSIHAVTSFFAERSAGREPAEALRVAYGRVLPPVVYTTGVVTLGFAVLGLSDFILIQHLGLLTAGLMVLCLLADALLLPALLAGLSAPGTLGGKNSS